MRSCFPLRWPVAGVEEVNLPSPVLSIFIFISALSVPWGFLPMRSSFLAFSASIGSKGFEPMRYVSGLTRKPRLCPRKGLEQTFFGTPASVGLLAEEETPPQNFWGGPLHIADAGEGRRLFQSFNSCIRNNWNDLCAGSFLCMDSRCYFWRSNRLILVWLAYSCLGCGRTQSIVALSLR